MKAIASVALVTWPILSLVSGQQCVPTTRDTPGPFFEQGAPNVKRVVPEGELSPSTSLTLTGRVLDSQCRPLENARVDIWYAGGSPVHYTFPPDTLWYRGWTATDADGAYRFEATYPGTYTQRPIPHVHYKVVTPAKEFVTQLYFKGDVPPSYEDYVRGRDTQFPQGFSATKLGKSVKFDIVLD